MVKKTIFTFACLFRKFDLLYFRHFFNRWAINDHIESIKWRIIAHNFICNYCLENIKNSISPPIFSIVNIELTYRQLKDLLIMSVTSYESRAVIVFYPEALIFQWYNHTTHFFVWKSAKYLCYSHWVQVYLCCYIIQKPGKQRDKKVLYDTYFAGSSTSLSSFDLSFL